MTDLTKHSSSDLIQAVLKLRDKKDEISDQLKAKLAPINEALDSLSNELLHRMNNAGTDSMAVRGVGTAYKHTRTSTTIVNRDDFLRFVVEEGNWEYADMRANKPMVEQFLKEHEAVPPGVKITRDITVKVRTN